MYKSYLFRRYFQNFNAGKQMTIDAHIVFCKCLSSAWKLRFFHCNDFPRFRRKITHVKDGLIEAHHFCGWDIAAVGPGITFTLDNDAAVCRSAVKAMCLGRIADRDGFFQLQRYIELFA